MAAHLFFCEAEREIPSLNRGWRTPDPSPTRDAGGMQGYMKLCVAEPILEDGYPCPPPPYPQRNSTWTSRTPSPSDSRSRIPAGQVYGNYVFDQRKSEETKDDVPTPRMQLSVLTSWPCGPRNNFNCRDGPMMRQGYFHAPDLLPMQQRALPQTVSLAAAIAGDEKRNEMEAMEACGDCYITTVSAGSVGHPYSCAEPCKYVRKRNRGCKDGAACARCHLCEWKKTKGRK